MKDSSLRGERGMALTELALLLLGLMASLALVVDIGRAYAERWRMQNAADAAALAGTRALYLGGAAQARQAAAEYAQRNGAKNAIVTVDPVQQTVRVEARTDFPTFVATILGIDTLAANNPAQAIHGAVSEFTTGLYPIAVDAKNLDPDAELGFEFDKIYDMYVGTQPGNFGWLSWNGTMAEGYLCSSLIPPGRSGEYINPENPNDHVINIGDWVWGRPGVANSICVRNALDNFEDNRIPITIVVWDQVRHQGSDAQYRVAGFAEFVITYYRLPGTNQIMGMFKRCFKDTTKITTSQYSDFGVHGVKLTE